MDEAADQKRIQTPEMINKCIPFINNWWALRFVVSLILFSLFLRYSYSSVFSLFPHCFNVVYLSTCLFSFFTHALERKYMFLLCNGILAFLANSSASCNSSDAEFPTEDGKIKELRSSRLYEKAEGLASIPPLENTATVSDKEEEEEDAEEAAAAAVAEKRLEEEGNWSQGAEKDKVERQDAEGNGVSFSFTEEEEEEEGEESEEMETTGAATKEESTNTEELNRKFEEFIRKMKEEIRLEAQRQLIAV